MGRSQCHDHCFVVAIAHSVPLTARLNSLHHSVVVVVTGDGVLLGAGVTVLGPVTIGTRSKVRRLLALGLGQVVTHSTCCGCSFVLS